MFYNFLLILCKKGTDLGTRYWLAKLFFFSLCLIHFYILKERCSCSKKKRIDWEENFKFQLLTSSRFPSPSLWIDGNEMEKNLKIKFSSHSFWHYSTTAAPFSLFIEKLNLFLCQLKWDLNGNFRYLFVCFLA